MSVNPTPSPTLEIDGHLFIIGQISGITKVLLTPPDEQGLRNVFFDVLMKNSSTTLRVNQVSDISMVDQAGERLNKTIDVVEGWRQELIQGVKNYLG